MYTYEINAVFMSAIAQLFSKIEDPDVIWAFNSNHWGSQQA